MGTENWKGVPMPENVRRGVATGFADDPYVVGWKEGVDAALASRADSTSGPVLKITGWALASVRAFGHLAQDDPDTARRMIRDMSPRDRAVLAWLSGELSRLVSEEEDFRTTADRRRVREAVLYGDEPDTSSDIPTLDLSALEPDVRDV